MRRSAFIIGLTTTALVIPGTVAASAEVVPPPAGVTEWVSDDGGSAGRELPAMSADGRYVVLVGRSSATAGVWIKDRANPAKPAWRLASGFLFNPDISADGKVVTWAKYGSGSGGQTIYVLEWQKAGAVPEEVSLSDSGQSAASVVDYPSISGDGRYVAFQSMDKSLDADVKAGQAGGGPTKVYVRDRVLGETEMVSVVDDAAGDQMVNGNAVHPDISPDGRYVAFASDASALQAAGEGETTTFQQVYLRDRGTQTTLPVSLAGDGTSFGDAISAPTYGPSVSDDGTKVAFASDATDLVAGDTNGDTDAFVRDMVTGSTVRISLDSSGAQMDLPAPVLPDPLPEDFDTTANVGEGPFLSGNGAFVAFESDAALTADDVNGSMESTCTDPTGTYTSVVPVTDIYLYGLGDASLVRQSVKNADAPLAFEASGYRIDGQTGLCTPVNNGVDAAISGDGTRVAFVSNGNLIGREIVAEEGETPSTTSAEPNVYLRRPVVEPDIVAPTSQASSAAYTNKASFTVRYAAADDAFPSSGLAKVDLYVKRPGATSFSLVMTDAGAAIDKAFLFASGGVNGSYRFYTVATDVAGNVEAAPAVADTVTVLDTVAPVITRARVVPNPFDISTDRRALLAFRVSEKAHTRFVILSDGVPVRTFPVQLSPRGLVDQYWAGRNDAGRLVLNGRYVVRMRAVDLAGNATVVRVVVKVTR